jgi:hypothetical protein
MKLKPWNENHKKKYIWLFNYIVNNNIYPNANEDNYILTYKRYLSGIIDKAKWSDGSKEGLYFMIARWLDNHETNKRYVKIYQTLGHDLMIKNKEKENKNEMDEKEEENYRDHEYFINIIDKLKDDNDMSKSQHYKYLLLNLLVFQPPLRTSFYTTCRIIRKQTDNDNTNNFLLINKRGSLKCYYIVNKDKATNYKMYSINKNLSKIQLNDKHLCELINESYTKFPRNYLFEINDKPISQNTLLNWLRSITSVNLINIDMMRSSYINHFYESNLTYESREKLSKNMRHSTETAQRNYRKINKVDTITDIEELREENKKLKIEIQELKKQINDNDNLNNNVDDKIIKKRRRDILYKLNKGFNVKEQTIKSYDIKYDDQLDKFV